MYSTRFSVPLPKVELCRVVRRNRVIQKALSAECPREISAISGVRFVQRRQVSGSQPIINYRNYFLINHLSDEIHRREEIY